MSYQPFLISAFTTGLDREVQPWILPQDAFQSIINGFVHHGVLTKRAGTELYGQMVYDNDPNPQNPIMGIESFIDTDGTQRILIFDTKRAAIYNSLTGDFDPLDTADIFDGDQSSFINSAAFGRTGSFATSTFFFTNFNGDIALPISPIRIYTTGTTTSTFVPDTTPTLGTRNYIIAAQFIFAIKQRLILLNTVESDTLPAGTPPVGTGTNFAQRMRWCRSSNPAASGNNWDENTPGNGNFVDAPTSERIIGATQLEDTIIVQFSNSVWVIEYTADPALPFRWIKVNNFRACDAPYANIGHDRFVISFGKRGIVASDRTEVQRIDDKIEKLMMQDVNLNFVQRMYSDRDYTNRRSWTLFPDNESETSNLALIRTEEEGAWSIYNVTMFDQDPDNGTNMSCLGYGRSNQDVTFDDIPADYDFNSPFADESWDSYFFQSGSELFLGGDQIGRILLLEKGGDDLGVDVPFEVTSAGWNPFKDQGIQAQMGYVDFYVDSDTNTQFTVEFFADDITSPYASQTLNCLPNLGFLADIVDVTLTNPVIITAPSHGLHDDQQIFIYGVNGTAALDGGPYTVTVIDQNTFQLNDVDGTAPEFAAYEGGGQIVERTFENDKCWKRAYAGGKGYQHYIRITNAGSNDNLRFNAFMPWFRPSSRMIGG